MSDDRFSRIRELFERVSGLEPEARAAFLERECPDPDDRAEVESLLEHAGEWTAAPEPAEPSLPSDHELGDTIGAFTLTKVLGEGGFGIVYLADQSEPVKRTVALKVLKSGMDSRRVVARFEEERQALARMDHPCIARFFEGGLTRAGRPYFVMEHVDGLPITKYCRERRLPVNDRVRLMIDVCGAIQHAHARGIIHRDLKPSNILVHEVEGKPTPVIIDFGIARAVERPDRSESLMTQHGSMIGTPEYMSPEQVTGGEHDIDTRADVYALGVVLYELLAGRTPLASETTDSTSLFELQKILTEYEPRRPSRSLAESGGDSGLASRLRADLDWIVMRCLERDPARRYETAQALERDLRNELAFLPVTARAPSVGYVAAKFVRRNKIWVAASVLAACGLLAGSGLSLWFGLSAEAARQNEQEQRIAATRNAERVTRINEFLLDDLFQSSQAENLGPDATLPVMLDSVAPTIDVRFADDPVMLVRLHTLMGGMRRNLSQLDASVESYSRAIDRLAGATELGSGLRADPYIGRSQAYVAIGMTDAAEADARRAADILQPGERKNWEEIPVAAALLGNALAAKREFDEAERLFAIAIPALRASEGHTVGQMLGMMTQRIGMLNAMDRKQEVLDAADELVRYADSLEGNEAKSAAHFGRFWRTQMFRRLGRYGEAVEESRGLLESSRELFGEESVPVGMALMTQGLCTIDSGGSVETAVGRYSDGMALIAQNLGEFHYELEKARNNFAIHLGNRGFDELAVEWRTRGLMMRMYVAGPGEPGSVLGLFEPSREVVETDQEWIDLVVGEFESLETEHPKRARFGAHVALLRNACERCAGGVPAADVLERAADSLRYAERIDEAREIIRKTAALVYGGEDAPEARALIERINSVDDGSG